MVKVVINGSKGLVQFGGQSGATRIEEGVDISRPNANVDGKLKMITANVVVANGAASNRGKSTETVIPAGFTAISAHVEVVGASTNAVTVDTLGTEADPNGFCTTGMGLSGQALGSSSFACGGALALATSNSAGAAYADEPSVTLSGDPGLAGCEVKVSLLGYVFS